MPIFLSGAEHTIRSLRLKFLSRKPYATGGGSRRREDSHEESPAGMRAGLSSCYQLSAKTRRRKANPKATSPPGPAEAGRRKPVEVRDYLPREVSTRAGGKKERNIGQGFLLPSTLLPLPAFFLPSSLFRLTAFNRPLSHRERGRKTKQPRHDLPISGPRASLPSNFQQPANFHFKGQLLPVRPKPHLI